MERDPKKEIMLYPKWPTLLDGLGYSFLMVGGMPGKDRDGREIITLTLKTDETTRKRYNLRLGKEVDELGNVNLVIGAMDLIALNPLDKANEKWIYIKSFDGQETDLSKRESFIKMKYEKEVSKNSLLQATNAKLVEQLELAKTNPAKYIKQYSEVYQDAYKNAAESLMKGKGEQQ